MLSRFDLIPERYGQTDGQTDLLYQYRTSVYWRAIKMTSVPKSWYTAFSFYRWKLKRRRVKAMGTCGKINYIWWNIKINLQKFSDMCGYELSTIRPNFTQKDSTEVKMFQIVLGGYFYWNKIGKNFQILSQMRVSVTGKVSFTTSLWLVTMFKIFHFLIYAD